MESAKAALCNRSFREILRAGFIGIGRGDHPAEVSFADARIALEAACTARDGVRRRSTTLVRNVEASQWRPKPLVDKNWDAEMKAPSEPFFAGSGETSTRCCRVASLPQSFVDAPCPICSGKDRVDCAQKLGDHVSDYEWNYAEIGIGRRNLRWPHDF